MTNVAYQIEAGYGGPGVLPELSNDEAGIV